MSQENVEIVRRGYEAYARGDMAAMLADLDPDMVTYREEPDGATFKGRDGFLEAIAEWVEDFDEFVATAEELIDANDRQVVVRVHQPRQAETRDESSDIQAPSAGAQGGLR